jgi:hypothetical protein
MNLITIESKAYFVNNKELSVIKEMQKNVENEKIFKTKLLLEKKLSDYLTEKTESRNYKCLGYVMFDFRI